MFMKTLPVVFKGMESPIKIKRGVPVNGRNAAERNNAVAVAGNGANAAENKAVNE